MSFFSSIILLYYVYKNDSVCQRKKTEITEEKNYMVKYFLSLLLLLLLSYQNNDLFQFVFPHDVSPPLITTTTKCSSLVSASIAGQLLVKSSALNGQGGKA